ncbi:MAG: serine hydrolase [Treponema sp.]|nr:serine hydrolase [Treponema sp.]
MNHKKILSLLAASIVFFSCTTTQRRALVHRDANVKDYQWLPSRSIQKGSETRNFAQEPDEKTKQAILEAIGFSDMPTALKKTRTQALVVVRGEKILLEEYGMNCDHNSIVTSFSVAKSVNSAMVGTLIESGKIKSEDEPVTNYIPELLERDERFALITIKNLLNMSSGILYAETPNPRMDNTETYYNPNLRKLALTNTLIKEEPGTHFLYNNYNPLLLGLIIERVAKQNVCEYLSQSIWSKIGCERDATWSLDSDKDAFEKMESGINTIAMDFVRFACMYRDGGKVFGKQVVSQEWIKKSLASPPREADYYSDHWGKDVFNHGASYGLAWYVYAESGSAANPDFFGIGNKGQIIYISPSRKMVMARFGEQNIINLWKWIEAFKNIER